jgi:hypothetical protein
MAMANLQEVKRKKEKKELVSENKQSGMLSSFLRLGGKKSDRARKVSMNHDTAQEEVWDDGPNMNEIMPAAYTSPMRHADQDAMKVQEVEDLY